MWLRRYGELRYCNFCGRQFRIVPSQRSRIYCSRKCYRLSESPSSLEVKIEDLLKSLRYNFETQWPFSKFFCDFYLPRKNLVIEVDGKYWHSSKVVQRRDIIKDKMLRKAKIWVIRLNEVEVKNMDRKKLKNIIVKGIKNAHSRLEFRA